MFGHSSSRVGLLALGLLLAGCADEQTRTSSGPSPSAAASPSADPDAPTKVVPASANIFGAGHAAAPAPGGGGGGTLPVMWSLPAGANLVVTFPEVSGEVTPVNENQQRNPAEGQDFSSTDITSYGGISGVVHRSKGMFLVGVFLADREPTDPPPPRLDVTESPRNKVSAPLIGQTFHIGDGVGRSYRAPATATRLFVGFADAATFHGAPGYYGNNSGRLSVTVATAPG